MAATTSTELAEALRTASTVTASASESVGHWFIFRMDFLGRGDPFSIMTDELGISLAPGGATADFPWTQGIVETNGSDFPNDGDIWMEKDNFSDGWSEEETWEPFAAAIADGLMAVEGKFKMKDGAVPIEVVEIRHHDRKIQMGDFSAIQDWSFCCEDEVRRGATVEISLDPFAGQTQLPEGEPPIFHVRKVVLLIKPGGGWF